MPYVNDYIIPTSVSLVVNNTSTAVSCTIPALSGRTLYVSGFTSTIIASTSGFVSMTVAGLSGSNTSLFQSFASAPTITPLTVYFNPALAASTNSSVQLQQSSTGAANSSTNSAIWGYYV